MKYPMPMFMTFMKVRTWWMTWRTTFLSQAMVMGSLSFKFSYILLLNSQNSFGFKCLLASSSFFWNLSGLIALMAWRTKNGGWCKRKATSLWLEASLSTLVDSTPIGWWSLPSTSPPGQRSLKYFRKHYRSVTPCAGLGHSTMAGGELFRNLLQSMMKKFSR